MFSLLAAAPHAFGGAHAFWPLFIVGHVIWFVIIVLVIIFIVTGRRRRMARWGAYGHPFGAWGNAGRGAESTLAERFAQGDIDEKEYRARLEVLRASNGPTGPTR